MRRTVMGLVAGAAMLAIAGPARAQAVTFAVSDLPPSRGVPSSTLTQSNYLWRAMFDALTVVDAAGEPQPRLALGWEAVNRNTWRVKLRSDVSFHNGRPFDADAVVAAISHLVSDDGKKNWANVYGNLRNVAGATRVDALTVDIATVAPGPLTASELASLLIVEPKAWGDLGAAEFARAPVGTGSFRASAWSDQDVQLARFDRAWRPAKAAALRYVSLPEPPARVQALTSGQVDVALVLVADDRVAVERSGGALFVEYVPSVNVLVFNMLAGSAMQDVRVRRALNHAVDKGFARAIHGDKVFAGSQPASRSVRGFQPDIAPYAFDPARARALLREAGVSAPLTLQGEFQGTLTSRDTYAFVVENLKQVGVNLELRQISLPDLVARANGSKEFEGQMFGFNYGSTPTIDMMRSINALHSCGARVKWTCFPAIEPTIAAVNGEFDMGKRAQGLREIARYYHDNAPVIWLEEQATYHGVGARVRGFRSENYLVSYADLERLN